MTTEELNEAGRVIMSELNLSGSECGPQSDLSAIYKHKEGGGVIYVGNVRVAESLSTQRANGITRVVNCTHDHGALPNYHEGAPDGPKYYTFPISGWQQKVNATNASGK
jgi:hypothetical protein